MANYNQQDINQATGTTIQAILKKAPIMIYEVTKWIISFIKDMYGMIVGK